MTTPDITSIPAPRVSFVDPRTGLISREWYRWLVNIFTLTGAGQVSDTVADLLVAPVTEAASNAQVADLRNEVDGLRATIADQESRLLELMKMVQALDIAPVPVPDMAPDMILVKAGSKAIPSIANKADTDTGLFFPEDGSIAVTTNGTERFRINDTGDIAINPGTKVFLDGVDGTGNTYLTQAATGEVSIFTAGEEIARFTPAYTQFAVSGEEAVLLDTGYTKFSVSGVEAMVLATGFTRFTISGVEAFLISAGGTISFPGAVVPGAGFSGTASPPLSLTVVNGIVTGMT